jgi:hypothetical protein
VTTLAGFLLARIADDEAVARGALNVRIREEDGSYRGLTPADEVDLYVRYTAGELRGHHMEGTALLMQFTPARVLAECNAKRRMIKQARERIEAAEVVAAVGGPDNTLGRVDRTWQLGAGAAWHTVLRLLALPYAGHEDYRPEWKP